MKNLLAFLVILFVLNACDTDTSVNSDNNNSDVVNASYLSISTKVFDKSCALGGCHGGTQNPNLSSSVAYNNIVDKQSSQGLDYIEPGIPASSYLYLKITGASGINGARMPRNASPLSQAKIDSIRSWIEQGALNN